MSEPDKEETVAFGKHRLYALVFFGLIAYCLGCSNESNSFATGSLFVRWIIPGKTCDALQVVKVRLHLLDKDLKEAENFPKEYNCGEGTAGVTIHDIPVGTYTIQLEGISQDGKALYEGSVAPVVIRKDEVTNVSPAIVLQRKKASFVVIWDFPSGTGHCAGNKVGEVEVNLYDDEGWLVQSQVYPCVLPPEQYAEGGVVFSNLKGDKEYTFILYGWSIDGHRTFRGETTQKANPDEQLKVVVMLERCPGPDQCL